MPSEIIYCSDCAAKTKEIEETGAFRVVSCDPLPDQDNVPEAQKRCEIVWEAVPI